MRQLHQHALGQAAVQVQQQRLAPGAAQQHATAPHQQIAPVRPVMPCTLSARKPPTPAAQGEKQLVHRGTLVVPAHGTQARGQSPGPGTALAAVASYNALRKLAGAS